MPALLPSLVLALVQNAPSPVIDVHLHHLGPRQPALEAALDSLNVTRNILIGTQQQLREGVAGRHIRALTLPCAGGRMPNSGVQCYDNNAEFPDTVWLRQAISRGEVQALAELNTPYLGLAPDDPSLAAYYRMAQELDIPVGIHLGIGPPGVAYEASRFLPVKSPSYSGAAGSPMLLERVLTTYPRLRVYVMHAAWPFRDQMLYMLYMHPNLHVDIAVLQYAIPRAAYYAYLRDLIDAGFGKRIMFGSDGDGRRVREGIDAIRNAEFLTSEQKADILYGNAQRFFRVQP
jgi:uncharacterized protein